MTEIRIRPFEEEDYPAIVEMGNAIYADYPWSVDETRHEVHPAHQRNGLGGRLYKQLMDALADHRPVTVWTGVRETFAGSIRFVTRRGFHESRGAWESRTPRCPGTCPSRILLYQGLTGTRRAYRGST